MTGTGAEAANAYLRIDGGLCLSCAACVAVCPTEALLLERLVLRYDPAACVRCGECAAVCPVAAIRIAAPDRESP
ncbi:MAG: 4Fe-4S binding protein [Candidatus Eisenbacteria bacterium]|nr:4Fe-4S binding protein [Candidatus Eisenbacteria bacterium]